MLNRIIAYMKKLLGYESSGEVNYIGGNDTLPSPRSEERRVGKECRL